MRVPILSALSTVILAQSIYDFPAYLKSFPNHKELKSRDSKIGKLIDLHWKIDGEDITFALTTPFIDASWYAIGLDGHGGMKGADVMMIRNNVNGNGDLVLDDRYTHVEGMPLPDATQDLTLLGHGKTTEYQYVSFKRKLKKSEELR
jgi:hypothetical protein